jgi:hypothetical protein
VTAIGVAAVASAKVVGRGEDEVRALVVEVFRAKVFAEGLQLLF